MSEEEAAQGAERGGSRAPRVKLSELAAVELPDGRTVGVRVSDVSASGLRMQTPEPFSVGQKVMLLMRRYDAVPVEIRWSEGLEAGAVFLAAADASVG